MVVDLNDGAVGLVAVVLCVVVVDLVVGLVNSGMVAVDLTVEETFAVVEVDLAVGLVNDHSSDDQDLLRGLEAASTISAKMTKNNFMIQFFGILFL